MPTAPLSDTEIQALMTLLGDTDAEVQQHVCQRIKSLGIAVIPYLEKEWGSQSDEHVQAILLDLIHELQFERLKAALAEWKAFEQRDLLKGLWILATYQFPDLSLVQLQARLKDLTMQVQAGMQASWHPYDQVSHLTYTIFDRWKFKANKQDFHNINNSLINQVLESGKGNPISLCVLYILLAQELQLPLYGVNFPNLFLLTYKTKTSQFYVNAFSRGLILQRSDIDSYLRSLGVDSLEVFYEPCSHIDIVRRFVRNMWTSFDLQHMEEQKHDMELLLDLLADDGVESFLRSLG